MIWNKWPKGPIKIEAKKGFNSPKAHTAKAIAEMLKDGMKSEEIGEELGISASTVRSYIHDYKLR